VRNIDSGTINGEYCGLLSSKRRVDEKKKGKRSVIWGGQVQEWWTYYTTQNRRDHFRMNIYSPHEQRGTEQYNGHSRGMV
jgi:hypothetical protein